MLNKVFNKVKFAVLISGNGSNLQALIDTASKANSQAQIVLVISNKEDAYGLTRAKQAGIPTKIINHKNFTSRTEFDQSMDKAITEAGADFVLMAGFMRILSEWFVGKWFNRLVNIHPSLLPAFKGAHAQEDALKAGVKISGCTVHFVRGEVDTGPIITQSAVEVLEDDSKETLSARILAEEHKCYAKAMELIAAGKIRIEDEKVLAQ